MKKAYLLMAALMALVLAALAVPANAATTTSTVVIHGQTFTDFFQDGLCGPEPQYVTFTFRTEVIHATEHADGSFSFHDTATGTYHTDFVDPALPDLDSQQTSSFHLTLAPSGTMVVSFTFHDFPTGLKIWQRFHLTVVDGTPVVERDITKFEPACP